MENLGSLRPAFGFPRHLIVVLAGILIGAGCNSESQDSDSKDKSASSTQAKATPGPIDVVVSVGMVADLVRNIGGDHVSVTQLCGSTVDPHLHKATRDDVSRLMKADMIFYSGLMLEGKMAEVLSKLSKEKPVVAVADAIRPDLHSDSAEEHPDPHLWMDVSTWTKAVDVIEKRLAEFDPTHADDFANNADLYEAEMVRLHQYGEKIMKTIPESARVLVTSHDAFNFFGLAYHVEVDAVQGISTESEAGLTQINQLVDKLVEKKVRAVFFESSVPRKNIIALIEGARSRGHEVASGGELFSDAMGPEGTYEGTYIGMMDHNLTTIVRALGGEAPEKGLNGKLQ
jgi:manganese/zinc/iron transport system substrate-binding protein